MTIDGGLIARGWTGPELVGVAEGEWWRLVTSGFPHANLMHIGFNCLVPSQQWQVHTPVTGGPRFVAPYFYSMFTSSFALMLLSPTTLPVAAPCTGWCLTDLR